MQSKEKWKQNAKSGMSLAQGGKESEEQSGNDGQAGAPIADNSYRPADLAAHLYVLPVVCNSSLFAAQPSLLILDAAFVGHGTGL